MQNLLSALQADSTLRKIIEAPKSDRCPAVISGLSAVHRAHLLAAACAGIGQTALFICADEMEAMRAAGDLRTFFGEEPVILPQREFVFRDYIGISRDFEQKRIEALYNISAGNARIIVATPMSLMHRTAPPEELLKLTAELSRESAIGIDEMCDRLSAAGYVRCETVESSGQFARRGGILDFFSPAHDAPVRAEYWGDEIDTLSFFDPASQRRTDECESAIVIPVREIIIPDMAALSDKLHELLEKVGTKTERSRKLREVISEDISKLQAGITPASVDRYIELLYPFASAVDYFPDDTNVMLSEPNRVRDAAERFYKRISDDTVSLLEQGQLDASLNNFSLGADGLTSAIARFHVIMADAFTVSHYPLEPKLLETVSAKLLPGYGGSLETAAGDLKHYASLGYSCVVLVGNAAHAELLKEFLCEQSIRVRVDEKLLAFPAAGETAVALGSLSGGMEYPGLKLAVLSEGQAVSAGVASGRRRRTKTNRERIASYTDLAIGDLVVHDTHGIGRFAGLVTMNVDNTSRDYIKIVYKAGDALYIPVTALDLISKYIGGGENSNVALSKLGGAEWSRVKSRARASARDMADELIALYSQRSRIRGHAFSEDTIWQTEFEDSFGYEDTDDQRRSTEEIKRDMEKPVPMDRLLCGDVGFGKTEVALRAAMKCILDGYQVAILVPTTVLCSQHFVTASKRFAGFPIHIESLSRFKSPKEIKKALRMIESGTCDLVIGTHRLLSRDVKFKKLGLLILDEEQRFGVAHKELLKEMTKQIDVLTLSATPIPRTLNMALSGIRDMSTIEEPPTGRQPVQTYVMEHDPAMLADAMRRELARGGQVYYLHNRIENIERIAANILEMIPEASVAVAHGRMDEETLSSIMERVSEGTVSILVCTTIIETGIDIPNVNTLIIEDADHMGLAQLHQIRGRVGRSSRRAYAYLTFRHGKVLTEIAEKRLTAIREFAEFNSGFRIAMRDLEIRGAGNLLGAEQSGHMMKVGYDMYLRLLEEAVEESLQAGEPDENQPKKKQRAQCTADFNIRAQLPASYVPSGETRLDLYRRIAKVETQADALDMTDELIDRFGDPPEEAQTLIRIARLRYEAASLGITEITQKGKLLRIKPQEFDPGIIMNLYNVPEFTGKLKAESGAAPMITLRITQDPIAECELLIEHWKELAG